MEITAPSTKRKRPVDPSIIRVGDRVRIIKPEFFIRCGYDNCHSEACEKIQKDYGEKILEFIYEWEESLHINSKHILFVSFEEYKHEFRNPHSYQKIISALAYDFVKNNKKAGAERKLFTTQQEEHKGSTFTVNSISIHRTGKYYPPTGYQHYDGDWDTCPGGIEKPKTHKILYLNEYITHKGGLLHSAYLPAAIEACNVEKVMEEEYVC